jgi:hypothetical protein
MITLNIEITLEGNSSRITHAAKFYGETPIEKILLHDLSAAAGATGNDFQKILRAVCAENKITGEKGE